MYKLLAIDMDGTLLNDQHEVSKEVVEALDAARERGIKVVLCSGRPIIGMRTYLEELGLNGPDDYAIGYNGGYVESTEHREPLIEYSLTHEQVNQLYNVSLELNSPMHIHANYELYTPNRAIHKYTINEAFLSNIALHYCPMSDMTADMHYQKVLFIDEPEKLTETRAALPKELFEQFSITQSAPYFLEFLNPIGNKGHAVKELAARLGIKQEEVMTFGDNENDVTMIEYAGCGVAMGNAIDEVKAVADFETLTNNEHGVAHAIQTLILDK